MTAPRPSDKRGGDATTQGHRTVGGTQTEGDVLGQALVEPGLPDRLGRFAVLSRLGRGAVGEVFEAQPPEVGAAPVALKAIRGVSPEALYRFKREFRALADVRHRNVIRLHELVLEGEQLFFSMELVRGTGFSEVLCGPPIDGTRTRHEHARDYDRVREAFRQLAEGVQAIHDAGFLHRDLKPSNILVEPTGRVVILDFGLVRDIELDDAVGVTADGAVLGTPLFMSPEQAAGEDVGPASDWYTVGEILYQVLTGRAPYAGLGLLALLAAKKDDLPRDPSEHVAGIPTDLLQLCVDLLARDPSARPRGPEVLRRLGSTHVARAAEDRSSPFLGRDHELRSLQRAFKALEYRRPVVVLLEGVSGIGKSALVEQFLRRAARSHGALVLSGKCSERESIPYKALDSVMDMATAYLRQLGTPDARALLPRNVAALVRLFPVLLGVSAVSESSSAPRTDQMPQEARRRGVAALRELLGRLAEHRPLIVHVDDLQWTDLDSLAVLESVLHHAEAPPMLLVGSFRESARERNARLGRFIRELRSMEPAVDVRTMRVGPMGIEEARGLALQMLGDDSAIHRTLATDVAREADGSPFFVAQLVRHAQMTRRGNLSATDSAVSLDDVIRHRLDLLPHEARRLLAVVSIAGGRLEVGLAMHVAGTEGSSHDALADLRAESLVRTDGPDETNTIEVYHDRIRETVIRDLDPDVARELHRRIGFAFERSPAPDAASLSHHFRQANEAALALRYTIEAADKAADTLAFERAAELYSSALELDIAPPHQRANVEVRHAKALANAGRLYEAAKVYLSAADRLPEAEKPALFQSAAELLLTSGHAREGRVVLKKVLSAHGFSLPNTRGRAIRTLLWHRAALAMRTLTADVDGAPAAEPHTRAKLEALWTAARGLIYTDGLLGAGFQAHHLRLALRSRDPLHVSRALGLEAHLTASIKPVAKRAHCFELLDHAEALATRASSPYARGMVLQARGHVHLFLGEWQAALDHLDDARRVFVDETTGSAQEIDYCEAHAALCLQFLGRARALEPRAVALLRRATQHAHPYSQGFARGMLAYVVHLTADRVDDAEEQLTLYRKQAPEGFQAHTQNWVTSTTALLRYRGDVDAAWRLVEARAPEIEAFDLMRSPFSQAEYRLWVSQNALAVARRHPSQRNAFLDTAILHGKKLVALPVAYQRAYGHMTLGNVHEQRGEQELAEHHFRTAVHSFDEHGMRGFAAVCRVRLAELVEAHEATALRADAKAFANDETVVAPARLFEMISPGSAEALHAWSP